MKNIKDKSAHEEIPFLPRRKGKSLFSRICLASVPSSIKSSFVITPIVRIPENELTYHLFHLFLFFLSHTITKNVLKIQQKDCADSIFTKRT